ncbi:MAG: Gfo/Idh/MocA family oxidoreductase [Bacteroidales bacterium]|jgi:predicted dehydrogenase|nr:Gfo/Idh/MocA family oxidoreductase [Bacteroidales bacterium]
MNRLRFGVIGTNFISDWVITGGRQDERFELAAVYSRTQETADAFAARHSIPRTFTSLEAMAADPLIDAVYVASPNALHAGQSIFCMEHGKHVLCEKAFASNAREAREMIAAARRNKVALMEAMKPTLTPNFLAARDALGRIGAIRRYFSCYCQYSSRYDKFREGTVLNAFRPEFSSGALPDIGIYTIYPMVVLFGRPQTVKAAGLKLSSGVDGEGSAVFSYPAMDAAVLYSKIANSSLPTEIQGEDGNIVLDRINMISEVNLHFRDGRKESLSRPADRNEYYYEIKEFMDTVQSGRQESAVNSWENSLITMEIMDEIRKQLGVVYPSDAE